MSLTSAIACPACGKGTIVVEPRGLLAGASFACPVCHARLAASPNSKPVLEHGLDELDALKAKLRSGQADGNWRAK